MFSSVLVTALNWLHLVKTKRHLEAIRGWRLRATQASLTLDLPPQERWRTSAALETPQPFPDQPQQRSGPLLLTPIDPGISDGRKLLTQDTHTCTSVRLPRSDFCVLNNWFVERCQSSRLYCSCISFTFLHHVKSPRVITLNDCMLFFLGISVLYVLEVYDYLLTCIVNTWTWQPVLSAWLRWTKWEGKALVNAELTDFVTLMVHKWEVAHNGSCSGSNLSWGSLMK